MTGFPAARSPTVRRALIFLIRDGISANLYANLTGGVFLVGYALLLFVGVLLDLCELYADREDGRRAVSPRLQNSAMLQYR